MLSSAHGLLPRWFRFKMAPDEPIDFLLKSTMVSGECCRGDFETCLYGLGVAKTLGTKWVNLSIFRKGICF